MTCDPLYFGRLRKEDEVMTYKSRFRLSVLKLTQTTFGSVVFSCSLVNSIAVSRMFHTYDIHQETSEIHWGCKSVMQRSTFLRFLPGMVC